MAETRSGLLLSVAESLAADYAALPQVEAVVVAGSLTSQAVDEDSDIDLYVYSREPLAAEPRAEIASRRAVRTWLNNQFWEPGDEWIERASGVAVDVMFRTTGWIEDQLDRVLRRHEASVGYSTCLWHNVLVSRPLFDRNGWFDALQTAAEQPYPEPLRRAIIAKNHPVLRWHLSSYLHQIQLAVARGDGVSVNHRVAALLASYFDILFALNRQPHPGEKRLVQIAVATCAKLPEGMEQQVQALLVAAARPETDVLAAVGSLVDGLDRLLMAEGLITVERA